MTASRPMKPAPSRLGLRLPPRSGVRREKERLPDPTSPADKPEATEPTPSRLLPALGAILAPTSLLTAVMFYFGWSFSIHFYQYFGVNFTVLGLTTQDYLLRSVDTLFVPVTVLTTVALLMRWAYILVKASLSVESRAAIVRVLAPTTALFGIALLGVGLWRLTGRTELEVFFLSSPLGLATGVLLLYFSSLLYRHRSARDDERDRLFSGNLAEKAGVFVLVGISLFWAAQLYASEVGKTRAQQMVALLDREPLTTVYSARSLGVQAPDVIEEVCTGVDPAYRFRYTGLVLVLQSGGQYFLLPRSWAASPSPALVIPRTDSIRLEFDPLSSPSPAPPC